MRARVPLLPLTAHPAVATAPTRAPGRASTLDRGGPARSAEAGAPPVPLPPPVPVPAPQPQPRPPAAAAAHAARGWRAVWPDAGDRRAAWVSALVMLPQAIAFAVLAGLPPEMGVWAAVLPVIVAALLGPSRTLLSGPNTAVAMMIGAALLPLGVPGSAHYVGLALTLSLMVGATQLLAAAMGIGRLLALLPRFVFTGLNMGIGLMMLCCQVAPMMGLVHVREMPSWLIPPLFAARLDEANAYALAVAGTSVVTGLALARWPLRGLPSLVGALVAGTALSALLDLLLGTAATGLDRVGRLDLASLVWAWPSLALDEGYVFKQLLVSAVAIAIVGGLQSVIILRAVGDPSTTGPAGCRRELLAQGVSNIAAACSGGFACSGSFNRTAAHVDAGARTRAAAVLSSLLLLALALALGPVLAHTPLAAIAGTLALVGWGMFRNGAKQTVSARGWSCWAALAIGVAVVLGGIEAGLILGGLLGAGQLLLQASARPAPEASK